MGDPVDHWVVVYLFTVDLEEQVEGKERAVAHHQVVLHFEVGHACCRTLDLLELDLLDKWLVLICGRVKCLFELEDESA